MTAVEWLVEQLKEYDFADIKDNEYYIIKIPTWILKEKEIQAKEMEKEQIIDFQLYMNENEFISNHLWDFEDMAIKFLNSKKQDL